MKTLSSITCVLVMSLLLVKCTPAKKPVVQVAPTIIEKEKVITKSFDAVWQAAVEWFATHNTPIKNLDKSSGLISTEYSVPMGQAYRYMSCATGTSTFSGKTETSNYSGNFNVLIKKISDGTTKISVNVFYGCTINKYRYKNVLSTEYILESSTRANCESTGVLEKEILSYLEAAN